MPTDRKSSMSRPLYYMCTNQNPVTTWIQSGGNGRENRDLCTGNLRISHAPFLDYISLLLALSKFSRNGLISLTYQFFTSTVIRFSVIDVNL